MSQQRYARFLDNLPTEFRYQEFTIRHEGRVANRPWSLYREEPEGDVWMGCFSSAADAQAEADAIAAEDADRGRP